MDIPFRLVADELDGDLVLGEETEKYDEVHVVVEYTLLIYFFTSQCIHIHGIDSGYFQNSIGIF